jgi:hypothetical protein
MSAWTPLEIDIMDVLTRRVRLLSDAQIFELWPSSYGAPDALARAIGRLSAGNLLRCTTVTAHPRLSIDSPVASWEPTQAKPSITVTMRRIRRRWTEAATPIRVYWASRQASNLLGTFAAGCPLFMRRDHDLLLGEVFIHYRKCRPDLAQHWLGEAAVPKADSGMTNPDALLFSDGHPTCAIESGGHSSREQVESFHNLCAERALAYEIW